jgi:hypothetical protein
MFPQAITHLVGLKKTEAYQISILEYKNYLKNKVVSCTE